MDRALERWYDFLLSMSETPAQHPVKRLLVLLLKIVVSGGLLWLLLGKVDLTRLWAYGRHASVAWLATALGLYLAMILVSAWRWQALLDAQSFHIAGSRLVNSYLVATFFNNFLPSNIGGDVIRIRDTVAESGSKTKATTIVLMDRGIGLLGLVLVAAVAATVAGDTFTRGMPLMVPLLWLAFAGGIALATPLVLWPGAIARLLGPLRRIHQEWVGERIARMTDTLGRFGQAPAALVRCFVGAVVVQLVLVGFYAAIARSMGIAASPWHLAVVVPVSFIVQMAPVSVNGFGIREAVFTYYFSRMGLPPESALAVSFMGAALIMLFSLSGAAAYWLRHSSPDWAHSPGLEVGEAD
jgi:glycosyltransferase 2 family protein